MNKVRCKDIFIACLVRLSPAQCEEIFQELQIEPGTLDFSEDYGRNKNVLLAEFKHALQEEEAHKTAVEEDIYECEHCNAEFKRSEILYRRYGGEIGTIAFCPQCKEATKLICITGVSA